MKVPRGGYAGQRSASDKEQQEQHLQHMKNIVELLAADNAADEQRALAVAAGQARSDIPVIFPNVRMQLQVIRSSASRMRVVIQSPKH